MSTVAKATASWSSGLAGIPRRSWRRRRPGYVADAPDDSLRESNRDHVKEVREGEIKREGEGKGRGGVGLHRKRRGRPAATADLRAPVRAAWWRSGGEVWGKRKRRRRAIRWARWWWL